MYYQDEYMKGFQTELEFHEHLAEIEGRGDWLRIPCGQIKVYPAAGNEKACPKGEEEIWEDTVAHTNLLLKTPKGIFQLGGTAMPSLKDRARINGRALMDLKTPILAEILNQCLKVGKGQALLRFCEGKIRGVLSGDQKDYAILPMPEIYMVASAYIKSDFQNVKFLEGYADHILSTAVWIGTDEKLGKAYRELLKQHGKEANGELKIIIRVTTSDVGNSGANIFYSLLDGRQSIVLGEALKLVHKNGKGMEEFTKNMEAMFQYYKQKLKGINRLLDIHLRYPANAMAGIMKTYGFSKKLIAETVEQFQAVSGNKPCSAYEVYCGICESLFLSKKNGNSTQMLIKMEEQIARCLTARWHDHDIPGQIQY